MASSSDTTITSSGGSGLGSGSSSCLIRSSGSKEDLQHLMDQKKKNRMISNRESARRSRKRKQKQLDDLETQLSQLRKQNNQMISSVNITTQHYMNVETENQVLQAQVAELSHQLRSLNEIIDFMYGGCGFSDEQYCNSSNSISNSINGAEFADELLINSLCYGYVNQPILASADMFMY
ncbi:hypothetical protein R6Q59_012850 [Mikania micrantha]